jgi:hypothetical protein
MPRVLVAAAAAALLAVPAARANGDPASDELITQQVYIGLEVPLALSDREELLKTVAAANERGYTIRVALIAFTNDLGSAVSLWRHPQAYAKFLGSELAFAYANRLLVAMPSGFGFYRRRRPAAGERRVLERVRAGRSPTALVRSTARAVRALAAADGVELPSSFSGGGSSEWRDRALIVGVALAAAAAILASRWWLRDRRVSNEPG